MINAYMNDTITLRTATIDSWGSSTYVETTIRGRFEFKTELVRSIEGVQVVSTAKVYLACQALTHKDQIGYSGVTYNILGISQMKDFSNKFLKVDLA